MKWILGWITLGWILGIILVYLGSGVGIDKIIRHNLAEMRRQSIWQVVFFVFYLCVWAVLYGILGPLILLSLFEKRKG